jgi:hypothetical protein
MKTNSEIIERGVLGREKFLWLYVVIEVILVMFLLGLFLSSQSQEEKAGWIGLIEVLLLFDGVLILDSIRLVMAKKSKKSL